MKQFIVISGIDGCGKTTIIEGLRKRLEQQGIKTRYEWMRYNHRLAKPVHGFCRLMGLSRPYQIDERMIWRHEFYRSPLFSSFYIALTWLDAWIGRLLLDTRLIIKDFEVVICDRWIPDIIVDLIVDTKRHDLLSNKWFDRFIRILPAFTRQYLITRQTECILAARPDVKHDDAFGLRQELYKKLGEISEAQVVNNDTTVDAAVDFIISDWMSYQSFPIGNTEETEHITYRI